MKKIASNNKLSLDRETLVPLQSADLDNVNGGTGLLCRSVRVSIKICTTTLGGAGAQGGQNGSA